MAVPRPVLIAILGLALCVTALIAVHGMGTEEETVAPPALPEAPSATTTTPAQSAKPEKTESSSGSSTKDNGSATAQKPIEEAGQQAAKPAAPKVSAKQRMLAAVTKDVEAGEDIVVLFFTKPGAADDTGARSAIRELRGTKGVSVYTPDFDDLAEYRPVLAGTGVSQIPSIVIVKPGKKALLVEGYVDSKSLRQQVTDATR